jgi:large subunit ribosomal protein L25
MKSIALSGNNRAERGTSNANNIRKEGKIPCVIYGGKDNTHFTVNEIALGKIINSPNVYFVELDIDGTKVKTIIKETQFHPVTDRVIHVDFLEVDDKKAITVSLPVVTKGASKGVLNGGKLRMVTRKLRINGLPSALPETIEVDITDVKIGGSIKIKDLNIEGLTILDAANAVVIAVKRSRVAVADEEDEEEVTEEGAEATTEEAAAE